MPAIVLPVHDIDELGKDYSFELGDAWLDEQLADTPLKRTPGAAPGRVELHAQRNDVEFLVNGTLEADLLVECCRCLGDVPLPIRSRVTALLSPRKDGDAATESELEGDDLDRGYYEGHELVLDALVREHLVVETPMQPLCSPDCQGIPIPEGVRPPEQDFSGPGGVDPRMAPLGELRSKLAAQSGASGDGGRRRK